MDNPQELNSSVIRTETVTIGDESSRISSAIFFLLLLVPVLSTVLFGGVDNVTWIIISIFWAAIILLWLVEAWKAEGLLLNPSPLQIPLLGLIAVGLIQLLPIGAGMDEHLAVPVSSALSLDPYSTRFFVIRLVVYLVFFAACLTFINNERRLKKAVLVIIIFGSLIAFFGILQRLANPDGIYGIRGTPQSIPFGPFVNQHHFAALMQMTAGVTLGLLFGRDLGQDKKLLLGIAVVLMGVACVFTSSRGGLLGFVSVMAFVAMITFVSGKLAGRSKKDSRSSAGTPPRKIAFAAAGAALILVIFGVALFLGGNESLLRGIGVANADADFSSGRAHFWQIGFRIFLEHPILGAGLDAFGVAFTKHDTRNGLLRVEQAHNEYLQILADAGLAGFICIAGFIYLLFRKGLATIANTVSGLRRDAAIGALAGCFGILVHSFFDFPLRTPSNAFFFLLLCAIATVPIQSGTIRKIRQANAP